ncbi:gamma-glutamylcyclotransferase family protein [Flagellimonas algicola]|uniref:Gamma-glutamylcyclotransferase n=1 Tax=Flagellimonas algicola TaxID=2583815 RepID=A0ABY2WIM9_9FLAO|nr:gamma-glutamylcyclotransferase family protein [Allomuricauda algicola]TMU54702.1 gamma-glutamylcyclotransferase [Allomuricauda algicola]
MEYLFTYGTLQDLQVQQYIFGRILTGKSDFLSGFKKMENAIYNRYPLVIQSGNPKDTVQGMVYEITPLDLAKSDIYETSAYIREKVVLESGIEAWLYVKNSN